MIGKLLKLFAYTKAPKTTFSFLHPRVAVQVAKTPFDFRTSYAPRIAAVATALLVGPLAYRLGKRAGEGTLRGPDGAPAASPRELLADELDASRGEWR
jgi:hypothetical protein